MQALPNTPDPVPTTCELMEAAMRACDHWGDGPQARQVMREQCAETPPQFRAELIDHFERTYQ